ncbi:MAG: SPASM domain-containing protein [Anaerolineae bacterium]|nr:SPASM domain-containing protein [Anaerolineae bacterium]MDW8098555.1 SPASM domain-containing protein [Anaerolineae bacterium]
MTDEQVLDFFRRELDPTPWLNPKQRGADFRFCGIGGLGCTIGPNGDVFSCVGARIRIGNVRQAPLRTIWRESPV